MAEDASHDDENEFRHSIDGVVSVPTGGKTFEFTIAQKPNPALDQDHLVIGRVLSGFEVLEKINDIPVSKEDVIGTKQGFSQLGKGFDPRAKLASIDRPLQKIFIQSCRVDEKAAVPSFLKF